jgi:hypothetical protein
VNFTVSIKTPKGVSPISVALGANGSITIGGATQIIRPGSALSRTTNVGTGGIQAEPDAVFGDVFSTSTVTLKDRVHVLGKVYAPGVVRGAGVQIAGGVDSVTPLAPSTVTTWTVTYPAATVTDVVLQPNISASRAPGRYGNVQIFSGAQLSLSSGIYYLDSLDLEPSAKILLNQDAGPVLIYVRNTVILRGTFKVLPTSSTTPPDLLFGYLGSAELFVEAPFNGVIVATNAKVTLRSVSGGHTGSFFGKNIGVDPNTQVTFRPGYPILTTQPPGNPTDCTKAILPSDSLTGAARELQFQMDIVRYCTSGGLSPCEQTLRARANVDYFTAAAAMITGRISTGQYIAYIRDHDARLVTFRSNQTLACNVASHDGDGDFVPDGTDACPTTLPFTPVLANGCTNSQIPAGPDLDKVKKAVGQFGFNVDPRCVGAPLPAIPAALGAFRSTTDSSLGKAVWLSRESSTSACPLYYEVEFYLTDGLGLRTAIFAASEEASLSWITAPAGAVQFHMQTSDGGDRAAWASYSIYTHSLRARAFNLAGRRSAWSDFFTLSHTDCVRGQSCGDL